MTFAGAIVGIGAGSGLLLVLRHLGARRGPTFEQRVLPYLARVQAPTARVLDDASLATGWSSAARLLKPSARAAAARLDRVLGGTASVRTRLVRAGDARGVQQFRLEQLAWGACGFTSALLFVVLMLARGRSGLSAPTALVFCVACGAAGVLLRDQLLNRAVARRVARIDAEFPTVAELLALAVAAGEGAAGALARVSRVCSGELAGELRRVLDDTRTGHGLADALGSLAGRIEVPTVGRFVDGIVVATERGTPLAEVLRAQAADAREVRRRQLMESAGRREIGMLVPVVFLILPVTVVFALFPGFYGLNLSVS